MRETRIVYSSHFLRALKRLPVEYAPLVHERTERFRRDCFDPELKTHKLKGPLVGHWSFSLTQKYRILFEFLEDGSALFTDVGDHSIYR